MINNTNEIYSDQIESEDIDIESVRQLDENEKNEMEKGFHLEELLRKSRQLNSSRSERILDQQIQDLPKKNNSNLRNLILSCNQLGKSHQLHWTHLPNDLHSLELSGNFLSSLNGIAKHFNQLESLGLSFNEIHQIDPIFSSTNLCLIDLSYNLLNNLPSTISSLRNLPKLRILFLHGNPLSLIVDYRLYVVDSLEKLNVLDDITITAEERFRARYFAQSNEHPKDYAQLRISFGTVENIPMPSQSENEWPVQIHRYKMRFTWFEGEKQEMDIPHDKFADFHRFNRSVLESSNSDYKPTIDFSPNQLNLSIKSLIPFRDFIFHGTTCQFIHQLTEYWQPGETIEPTDQKKKSQSDKDKKVESPMKKKKNEDLSKLITRKDPIETIFAEFHVELRPFLDGDSRVSFHFKSLLQQQIDANLEQLNPPPKASKKKDSSSRSNENKSKLGNENPLEGPALPDPFQCSISFELQRYISQTEII